MASAALLAGAAILLTAITNSTEYSAVYVALVAIAFMSVVVAWNHPKVSPG